MDNSSHKKDKLSKYYVSDLMYYSMIKPSQ